MSKNIIFSTSTELIRVSADDVVCITADGNYSTITTVDGGKYVLTMQLGQVAFRISQMDIDNGSRFARIGKSVIVNCDFITYIHPSRQKLVLSDCRNFKHELSASRDALKDLKELIDKENNKDE